MNRKTVGGIRINVQTFLYANEKFDQRYNTNHSAGEVESCDILKKRFYGNYPKFSTLLRHNYQVI